MQKHRTNVPTYGDWQAFFRENFLELDVPSLPDIKEVAESKGIPCEIRTVQEWSEMAEEELIIFFFNDVYVGHQRADVRISHHL